MHIFITHYFLFLLQGSENNMNKKGKCKSKDMESCNANFHLKYGRLFTEVFFYHMSVRAHCG